MMSKKDARKFVYSLPEAVKEIDGDVSCVGDENQSEEEMDDSQDNHDFHTLTPGKGSHFLITDPQQKWKILHASDRRYKKSHGHHVK
ncbi:uncharacterized protein LOC133202630 isoform X2 [Saccostrea echinata]|nr:uncharacterized protein LOC133190750 isoform X2 [Saccostrea echinata]XP_061182424.1 uncharacterized protein LOC133190750 isoform X2 [Saccostrea echinata]XP_061182425.1 uncharacterized protein LOC133190750 isoform X2 [Saccostrea echinata]XP_061194463.1 uncharacterized protein LOC133202630 isoform X2 [Saccostrea echinata]XP_061194464.1 uncharacterized protein LOC133202630 isoform X2 [Saccostrea echinata]XP_061194465.1 uncharacterized protein LOC133202630 isoform X2 [Saccostrea echinata]